MASIETTTLMEIIDRLSRMEERQRQLYRTMEHYGRETSSRLKALEDGGRRRSNTKLPVDAKMILNYLKPIIQVAMNWGVGILVMAYIAQGGDIIKLIGELAKMFGG